MYSTEGLELAFIIYGVWSISVVALLTSVFLRSGGPIAWVFIGLQLVMAAYGIWDNFWPLVFACLILAGAGAVCTRSANTRKKIH